MTNALTTYDPNMPTFFHDPKFAALTQKFGGGISTGAPPRISIKGGRLRTVTADGVATLSPENGGTTLEVLVLDAHDGISKFYYDHAYNDTLEGEDAAPACFSEDGINPSHRALRPQSRTCAGCPWNVWGSKITPTGSKVKACSDVKKVAVIPVNNLQGEAYMLGIPGASLKPWAACVNSAASRGASVAAMVIQLGFDTSASYPKLTFQGTRWVSQNEINQVADLYNSPEIAELLGKNDQPHQGPFATEQPGGVPQQMPPAAPAPQQYAQPTQQNFAPAQQQFQQPQAAPPPPPPAATRRRAAPPAQAPQPPQAAPQAAPQGFQQPPMPPMPSMPAQASQQFAPAPQPVAAAPAPTRRRGRPPAAAQTPQEAPQGYVPPAAPPQHPYPAAPVAAPMQAQAVPPPSAEMDALLDQVMG